ncbi:MAG: NADH-quinone oxidoreductase subunit H [Oscillospiraceae bacterium]|jgi:ech hydrogenase subunit B|nr:NADH-quinone oxidoreductase subunit H [Oscillospiraceae bacterium]
MNSFTLVLIEVLLAVIAAPIVGGLLTGIDRKITARMQRRKGPPLLQPFYDVAKLLQKESSTVNMFTRFFTSFSLFFTVLAVVLLFIGQDLLLCIFSFTLAMIFFVIMGYSGYSPYSFIGAERELIQIMCYEPMILIMAFGFYESTGSFKISETLVQSTPVITKIPLIFLGFIFILTIKLRKSPFDLSMSHHAHQELVKGITTELTGICMAMVEVTHWFETVFSLALVYVFFIWANPYSHVIAVAACLIAYFLEILIDNIFARLKWEPVLRTSWIVTGAASLANFIILGLI